MPAFSPKSTSKLSSAHSDLRRLFQAVVKFRDCTILEAHRDDAAQNEAHEKGLSKLKAGESKHNAKPSNAVDAAPYPIDWNDKERFYAFGGFVCGVAAAMGIKLRWGGDWDGDGEVKDQTFMDLVHFEVVE